MKQLTSPLLVALLCWVAAPTGAQAATGVVGIPLKGGNLPAAAFSPSPQEILLPAPVLVMQPPLFLALPQLGIYVAVNCPHDLFYHIDHYYLWWNSRWFVAPSYNGPWRVMTCALLPDPLRVSGIRNIRKFRDEAHRRHLRQQ